MNKNFWIKITGLYASILTIMMVLFEFFFLGYAFDIKVKIIISISFFFFIIVLLYLLYSYWKEKFIRIALLGDIACGKTFFIAVLFDYLQAYQNPKYDIYPWGKQTLNRILKFSDYLKSKRRLDPTSMDSNEQMEGKAQKKKTILRKKIHFEMIDSSGEEFVRIAKNESAYLFHETTFFDRYVLKSECVFLMISVDFIWDQKYETKFENMVNKYIIAVQIIAENNTIKKSRNSLALIISKSDLLALYNVSEEQTLIKIEKLINVIKKRFDRNEFFFVSSIKQETLDSYDYFSILPKDIEKPIIWCLEKLKRH
ncbi:hypothetical protein ACFLS9_08160 [Bacteroidota bacterium]